MLQLQVNKDIVLGFWLWLLLDYSRGGGRRNMSRKSMKKSKGGESGGAAGDSYRQDGYSDYQDGSAAPHTSFLLRFVCLFLLEFRVLFILS